MKFKTFLFLCGCFGIFTFAQARHHDDGRGVRLATDIVNLVGASLNLINPKPVVVAPAPVVVAPPPPPPRRPVVVAPPPPPPRRPVVVTPPPPPPRRPAPGPQRGPR